MRKPLILLTIWILLIAASCSKQPKSESQQLTAIGKEIVDQLVSGEYDKVTGRFDQIMLSSLPSENLRAAWGDLNQHLGPYQRQEEIHLEKLEKFNIVVVRCSFAKAQINVRVTLNDKRQISGLYFVPGDQPST